MWMLYLEKKNTVIVADIAAVNVNLDATSERMV